MEITDPKSSIKLEANSYRLQKILDIQNYFEQNKNDRKNLLNKYTRAINIINITDGLLMLLSIAAGTSGLILSSSGVATGVVIAMEGVSIGTGMLNIMAKYLNKKLQYKADKHQKILTLSESKLNTIYNHISKALDDGMISDKEFDNILEEENKFRDMKEEIRNTTNNHVSDEYINLLRQDTEKILNRMKNLSNKDQTDGNNETSVKIEEELPVDNKELTEV